MAKVNVKWRKKHHAFGYFAGAVGTVDSGEAVALYNAGYLIILPDEATDVLTNVNPLPAELPGREILFEEGFTSLDKIKEAGESLKLIKGIKQKMYTMIMAFIDEAEKK
jgi:hypothetical protein